MKWALQKVPIRGLHGGDATSLEAHLSLLSMVSRNKRRCVMPKFLALASLTTEGLKVLAQQGGSKRRDAIANMYEKMGGKLEVYCYAFGEYDVVAIGDVPDNATAAAMSLAINSSAPEPSDHIPSLFESSTSGPVKPARKATCPALLRTGSLSKLAKSIVPSVNKRLISVVSIIDSFNFP